MGFLAWSCTYLSGSTNNRALTVYRLFRAATEEYEVPSRLWSDKGGGNVLGLSVHDITSGFWVRKPRSRFIRPYNQRIERLWRDIYHCVCSIYHELFYSMEASGILQPNNDVDLSVLHCVFLPRINKSLQELGICTLSGWLRIGHHDR